ncbi:hypothetical protein Sjap_026673 [Stephania japonica]|uniref:Uncharacterized protein n=1 Tax=Stephania japonica TaxID=461633 RepID=A0AAP0DUL1_9MAGN
MREAIRRSRAEVKRKILPETQKNYLSLQKKREKQLERVREGLSLLKTHLLENRNLKLVISNLSAGFSFFDRTATSHLKDEKSKALTGRRDGHSKSISIH